jgi:pyruvate formate lyase activating enzyme
MMIPAGWIFNIQRFSLHDGPGIRTTVFCKGCPLRCLWCHNPEGLEQPAQVRLSANLCLHCGRCAGACDLGGHAVSPDAHTLHLAACTRCGQCVQACLAGALELVGRQMTVEEVLAVVRRDRPFYEQSGGGMTLSGGEPLAQFSFTQALLTAARAEAIATALETSAFAPWSHLEALQPLVDLWLVDLKHTDEGRHRTLTGVSNVRILENIRRMAAARWPLIVRIPWIPTQNADPTFLEGLATFLTSLATPPSVEFMLYHRLGTSKWEALGGTGPMAPDVPAATPDDVAPWLAHLQALGVTVTVSQ